MQQEPRMESVDKMVEHGKPYMRWISGVVDTFGGRVSDQDVERPSMSHVIP